MVTNDSYCSFPQQYEKMLRLHSNAMTKLPETMMALDDFHIPNDVKQAENLMQEGLKLKEDLVNMMAEAELSIDHFITELKEQNPGVETCPATKDYIMMMSSLNGLLEELKAKRTDFEAFWTLHDARVNHAIKLCHFGRTTEEVGLSHGDHMIVM